MSKKKLSLRLGDEIPMGIKVAVAELEKDNQRLQDENRNLRELLAFALAGLDSAPRSWGLKITHSDHIRKNIERFGMEPLQETEHD